MLRILTFLCLAASASAQVTQEEYRGQPTIMLTPAAASVIEYWGQRGIAADPLIRSLELRVAVLETQVKLYEQAHANLMGAQGEYREMLSRSGRATVTLEANLAAQKTETARYKEQAAQRGRLLMAAAAVVVGVLYLNLHE